ncbi:adaptor protein MecA [Dolosigranulum pigrum]|uniref:adaptor protein MecA n=1 Tax=Dolosigranulum pigrum TaxID=29394 RepID=UPI000DC498BC|nr:adaptor protein MecA [Dolosigranulum pigrum]QJS98667.1 adaptor protein MecA [Dolosigranulum pigrum]
MEIEHINEDTIRVKIDNEDLLERGVTFLDLLGNQQQIEQFFHSILDEVDIDDSFKDSDALTFQVMPKNNGMELFITKGAQMTDDLIEYLDDTVMKELEASQQKKIKVAGSDEEESLEEFVLMFDNIEQAIMLAQDIDLEYLEATLYREATNYYLSLRFNDHGDELTETYKHLLRAKALEFAQLSQVSSDVVAEYAEPIIEQNALNVLLEHFKSE